MQDDFGRTVGLRPSHWQQDDGSAADHAGDSEQLAVELTAAVIALRNDQPVVLAQPLRRADAAVGDSLPSETYRPTRHTSLEEAIRDRVVGQTGLELGYIEQLSTDCREGTGAAFAGHDAPPHLSIGYLALIRIDPAQSARGAPWLECYRVLPWEDWRQGRPAVLAETIGPRLVAWAEEEPAAEQSSHPLSRHDRLRIAFGLDGGSWDDQRVTERLDILDAAGLTEEVSQPMRSDHRRILANALGRLRAKIRNRPLVFELMPPEFTLFELQKTVEAILGPHLHKQNFRRLVEGTGLVEPTGEVRTHTGGRPAKLFRFRREVLLERPAPGVRVKTGRAA